MQSVYIDYKKEKKEVKKENITTKKISKEKKEKKEEKKPQRKLSSDEKKLRVENNWRCVCQQPNVNTFTCSKCKVQVHVLKHTCWFCSICYSYNRKSVQQCADCGGPRPIPRFQLFPSYKPFGWSTSNCILYQQERLKILWEMENLFFHSLPFFPSDVLQLMLTYMYVD